MSYRSRYPGAGGTSFQCDVVPHKVSNVGNSVMYDLTPGTDSIMDSIVVPGGATLLPAADGQSFLLENVGPTFTVSGSSDIRDRALTVRANPVSATTQTAGDGLGCLGTSCQPLPTHNASVTLACGTNPGASTWTQIAVGDLGYPTVVRVAVSGLAAGAAHIVTARVCVPTAQASTTNLTLAGFDTFPLAEALTRSSLTRGAALFPSQSSFSTASRTYDTTCRFINLLVRSGGAAFVAATAVHKNGAGAYAAGAAVPAPLNLTLTCVPSVSGAATTSYGKPIDAAVPSSIVMRWSNGFFDGTYTVDPLQPTWNGEILYKRDTTIAIGYLSSNWYLLVGSASVPAAYGSYYDTVADPSKNLLAITQWDHYTVSPSKLCPVASFYHPASQGCLACPANSMSRGGAPTALGDTSAAISGACTCVAGYYWSTDGTTGVGSCAACPAGYYKSEPGNDPSLCISCGKDKGYTSAEGATRCTPDDSAGGSSQYFFCPRYTFSGWGGSYDGLYAMDTATPFTDTTRNTVGEGRLAYITANGAVALSLLRYGDTTYWLWQNNRQTTDFFDFVQSARPPHNWTVDDDELPGVAAVVTCTCAAYGYYGPGLGGGCTCSSDQVADSTTGRCKDAISGSCAAGYASVASSCVDINECAVNNGGCSHKCTNSAGSYACSCPTGWGLDARGKATCRPCSDDQFVNTSAGSVCAQCPAGQRRMASGTSCGCPYGFVLTDAGTCMPPVEVALDIAPGASSSAVSSAAGSSFSISNSPIRGRYVACNPAVASGIVSSDSALSVRVWQMVSLASGAVTPPATLYLVYHPATAAELTVSAATINSLSSGATMVSAPSRVGGTWSVIAGSFQSPEAAAVQRYAYIVGSDLTTHASWPATRTLGSTTVSCAATGAVPAGPQTWRVWTPWPAAFSSTARLQLNASGAAAAALASLPTCGSASLSSIASATYNGDMASTLGTGSSTGLIAITPTPSPTPSTSPSPTASLSSSPAAQSPAATRSISPSASPSGSAGATTSPSGSATISVSPSTSSSASVAATTSPSASPSRSPSGSAAATSSASPSVSSSRSPSGSSAVTPSGSPSISAGASTSPVSARS